ncbi:UDP-N-acetylenolpyruvoylglucosamine reductase [Citrobacter koseri]|uniref:UDP-N-acetylenolpyruvoylglucosamine reductase n=1 Tax=Citrobacter koseri TaxID=545 RepID=A0A2X2WEP3_CITKO|nr:UDP-N-acetylenolpyruvoylglucosamine reductase [Citrobacter koseri]
MAAALYPTLHNHKPYCCICGKLDAILHQESVYESLPQTLEYLRIDQRANKIVCAENEQQLLDAWQPAKASNYPVLILGEGSNVLFLDTFHGTVIINRIKGIEVTEQPEAWHLHVGAGKTGITWYDTHSSKVCRAGKSGAYSGVRRFFSLSRTLAPMV